MQLMLTFQPGRQVQQPALQQMLASSIGAKLPQYISDALLPWQRCVQRGWSAQLQR